MVTGLSQSQGVLHAGGVLEPGVLGSITPRSVRAEFAGKVAGSAALLAAVAAAPLRACSLFSSLAALSGSGGQGSYAAANAVLDAWAAGMQVPGELTCCFCTRALMSESENNNCCQCARADQVI